LSESRHMQTRLAGLISSHSLLEVKNAKSEINNFEKHLQNLDPVNVLKRGYSITLRNGKAVKSVRKINKADILTTVLADGTIESTVGTIKRNE